MQSRIETQLFLLRPIEKGDVEAVHAYAGDKENTRFMPWGPNTPEDTRRFVDTCISRQGNGFIDFAICLKPEMKMIGACGIVDGANGASLGWILNKDYWGKGYMTCIASHLIKYCFEKKGYHRVQATCDTDNIGSFRVMEKNNMRREGITTAGYNLRGQWRDQYVYAISYREWKNGNTKAD